MKTFASLVLLAANALAQPPLATPQIGFLQDAAGFVRPVYGMAANFLIGEPIASGVVSSAFSGSFGWLKTDSSIVIVDAAGQALASFDADAGPALFAFSRDGKPALVCLLKTGVLLRWDGSTLTAVPIDWAAIAADAVLSIAAPDRERIVFLVQRGDGVWKLRVAAGTGSVESQTALFGVTAPVLLLENGDLVFVSDGGLSSQNKDGSLVHLAATLPDSFVVQQMGAGWLQMRDLAGGNQFAVRIVPSREGFFSLPAVSQ